MPSEALDLGSTARAPSTVHAEINSDMQTVAAWRPLAIEGIPICKPYIVAGNPQEDSGEGPDAGGPLRSNTRLMAIAAPTMAPLLDVEADFDTLVWRYEQLLRAGYGEHAASELAGRADIDLHTAAALIRRGCPQATALAILR